MEAGLGQLVKAGTLVLVGAGIERPRFDPNRILLNELTVTGSFVYDADGFERSLELLARPDFPSQLLLEDDDVVLDDLYGALEGLASGELPAKVLVVPWKGTP
jgi:threonine dehydrogenase-like Zn-dependent dehydrogenase